MFFGKFFNIKSLYRVDAETLKFSEELPIDLTLASPALKAGGLTFIQSATFLNDTHLILLCDDYVTTLHTLELRRNSKGKDKDEIVYLRSNPLLAGNEADGLTANPTGNELFVGFNRQHAHETIPKPGSNSSKGLPPMYSIYRYSLM
uniref:Phytase-like domain-containing protein n=2 Tax=Aplanochytrium stocchinoi TaxID=215587 RepID=A0A7S3PFQ2_9STRA|mmetsp:Transcript_16793/g.20721  ORF Transcript_16793/g.20721 Transcript_16793/m.20721 type:complete len:147 (-) Transcript_16793:414-854(-)